MRTKISRARIAAVGIAAIASVGVLAGPASAHDPIFFSEDQTTPDTGPYMPDGTISWALYGTVLEEGDTRGFEFDLRDGDELYISLLIPNLDPELQLSDEELPVVELTAPDGTTQTIAPEIREEFDEPFSNTSYITLAEIREPGQDGRYQGVVVGSAPSRFTVAIGEEELFFTPTERSGDRPSSFAEISKPLGIWYATAPGEEVAGDLAEGEGEIQLDMIEEAMESGEADAPEEALDPQGPETADLTDGDGSSASWLAPVVIGVVALLGIGGVLFSRRRETT